MSSTPVAEVDIGPEPTAAIRASTHAVGRWLLGEELSILGLLILRGQVGLSWGLKHSEYKSSIV